MDTTKNTTGDDFTQGVAEAQALTAEGLIGATNQHGSWELNGFSAAAQADFAGTLAVEGNNTDSPRWYKVSLGVTYPTLDYILDLTSSQMSGARSLTFAPYTSTSWDSMAEAYGSESGASSHSIYKITATAGQVYDVISVSYYDPYNLTVYDSLGNAIVTNTESDDPADYDLGDAYYGIDWIDNWTAPYSGTYYVDASWHQGSYFTFYDLSINKNKSATTVLPTLSLSSLSPTSVSEGNSSSTAMTINVTRTGDLSGTSSASWSVVGGTATASDFLSGVLPTGTVNFAAGQATATATINIAGDTTIESDENFTVTLSSPIGATLGANTTTTGVISNDDVDTLPPTYLTSSMMSGARSLTFAPYTSTSATSWDSMAEAYGSESGASSHSIYRMTATASQVYDLFSVSYYDPYSLTVYDSIGNTIVTNTESDDPADFELSDGGSYAVDWIKDWIAPYSGIYYVDASWHQGYYFTTYDLSIYKNKSTTVLPTLSLSPLSPSITTEGNSGYTLLNVVVTRGGDLSGTSSATWTVVGTGVAPVAADDFGGFLPSGIVSFAAGVATATVSINILGDTTVESNEDFTVTLSNPSGATLIASSVTGTINNDDVILPTLSLTPLSPSTIVEGSSGFTPITVTFTRSGDLSGMSTASWLVMGAGATADDFVGGVFPSGSVSFPSWQATATATINIAGDNLVESNENFTVVLTNPIGATLGTSTSATGTINNDDIVPTLSISPLAPTAEGSSGGATSVNVTVTRSGADLSGTSSASWAISGSGAVPATGADFVSGALPSGTVNFNAWEATAIATITLAADTAFEPDEEFTVTLTNPIGATLGTSTSTTGVITNDDSLPTLAVTALTPPTLMEGNSGATIATITFTRSGDLSGMSTANWSVMGAGTTADDFVGGVFPSGSVSFPSWQATATATINIAGDNLVESNENFTVVLTNPIGATLGTSTSATGTINNDDIAPTLSILPLAPMAEGSSGATSVNVTVTRSGADLSGTSSVSWAVSGSSAVSATGADFVGGALPTGTVNFNPWEATAIAAISLAADTAFEPDEEFTVTLTNPIGATLGTSTSTVGMITNDDSLPTLAVTALTPPTLMEGNSGPTIATITFTRSGDASGISSATWSVSGSGTALATGADFVGGALPTGSVTFAAGQPTATATFNIASDTAFEPNEEFTVTLGAPVGATLGTSTLTGTITNDDAQPTLAVALTPSPVTEGNSGSTFATVTVTRSGDLSGASSANWALTGSGTNPVSGTDFIGYSLPSGTVNFVANQPTATATFSIAGDTAFEPNEEFTVTLSNSVGATLGTSTASGTITNDDLQATLSVASLSPPDLVEGNADFKAITVNFTRSGDLSSTSSAEWMLIGSGATPVDAEDFVSGVLPTGKVDFAAGAATATATINVAGDTAFESNENFTVTLLAPVGATLGTNSAITGRISNDDIQATLAPSPLSSPIVSEGNSGTTPITVTVTRTGDLSSTSYANWALTGSGTTPATAADFVGNALPAGTISFDAGEATATITLEVVGDLKLETNENFTVTLSAPIGAILGASTAITGVIANDDTLPIIALSPLTSSTIAEGNKGATPITVTVNRSGDLSGISTANWTVSGSGANPVAGADFVGGNLPFGTVSFAAGQANASVTFNIAGELKIEPNEGFTVSLAMPTGATLGISAVTGTITTDDFNHAPTANNKTLTTDEDVAKTLTVADFGFSDVDTNDTLQSIIATSLPTAGSLTLKGKAVTLDQVIAVADITTGKLVFTPAPDANGVGYADFGFKVSDGTVLSESDYSLTFDVTAVRDDLILTGKPKDDTLKGSDAGNDSLTGLAGNDRLYGLAGMDTLDGGVGKDILDGGKDADSMIGGDGDDTYYVDNAGDIVNETNAAVKTGGTDLVYSSLANYTLTANVENGRISATGAANLTGNTLNNVLIAGAGDNVLNGGAGSDTVDYTLASKAVTVSLLKTTAQVTGGSGSDKLIAIENLTGSTFSDTLTGDGGANVLNGGTGNDKLTGGAGQDLFRFDSALKATNADTITDFSVKDDTIQLENAIFAKLLTVGTLSKSNFLASRDGVAKDADDFILYNKDSGALFYDADGSGAGAAMQFAIVKVGLLLTAADFVVS